MVAFSESSKHTIQRFENGHYSSTLDIVIHRLQDRDFGEYTCIAKNHLGNNAKTMRLLGKFILPIMN